LEIEKKKYAPKANNKPWAKLMVCPMPNTRLKPIATTAHIKPNTIPLNNRAKNNVIFI
jgi:hypothetical protein